MRRFLLFSLNFRSLVSDGVVIFTGGGDTWVSSFFLFISSFSFLFRVDVQESSNPNKDFSRGKLEVTRN